MLKRAMVRVATVALGATFTLVPTLAVTTIAGASTKGRAPNSALCKALHSLTPTLDKNAAAYKSSEKSRNWSAEKAAYLSGIQVQLKEYDIAKQTSGNAPHNVKDALPGAIKAAHSLELDLTRAKSAAQFTSTGSSVVIITFDHAQKPLLQYFDEQCGS